MQPKPRMALSGPSRTLAPGRRRAARERTSARVSGLRAMGELRPRLGVILETGLGIRVRGLGFGVEGWGSDS